MAEQLVRPEGELVSPEEPCGTGVLILAGSSGRVDAGRAQLFARCGATALSIRWFGGQGQQPDTYEVPLETFFRALDRLAPFCDRLAVVGTSFGAEAALLTAVHDQRVDVVVALAPTPVVWAGYAPGEGGQGARQTSHWTLGGVPLPFVPFDQAWEPADNPPAFRSLYAQSLSRYPDDGVAAAIAVEHIRGEVLVVGGEDDQVWPGADFARMVAARRTDHGLATTLITHPDAGHRTTFPGEPAAVGGQTMARGGTPEADADLGARAWPHVAKALRLNER